MLKSLLSFLDSPNPEPLPEEDDRLALAVLLVRAGKVDRDYSEIEKTRTDQILSVRYGLTMERAEELRQEAEEIEGQLLDSVRFTRALKKAVPLENRIALVEALWEVILVDARRDSEEDGYMRLVVKLLGIGDHESAFARQRVQARMK